MSKPLSIDPAVLRRLQRLPKSERVECLLAPCELPETFGRPHVQSGLGYHDEIKALLQSGKYR